MISFVYRCVFLVAATAMRSIPVIDFASCGLEVKNGPNDEIVHDVGHELCEVLRTYGFAYLRNSGISKCEIDLVNNVTKIFFLAPLEHKMKYCSKSVGDGYIGLNSENVDPSKPSDYKEAFTVNSSSLNNPDTLWPTDISENFSEVIQNFMIKCKNLAFRILKVLGVGLKLADTNHFAKNHLGLNGKIGNHSALRASYYPPVPSDMAEGHVRLGSHTDFGCITLLFQDNVGGLQVESPEGEFVDAVPIEDTVLINIGDMLQFWTRNRLKSTKHRVVNPNDPEKQKQARQSVAYFILPDDHVLVNEELIYEDSLPKAISNDSSSAGETALDYLTRKIAQVRD